MSLRPSELAQIVEELDPPLNPALVPRAKTAGPLHLVMSIRGAERGPHLGRACPRHHHPKTRADSSPAAKALGGGKLEGDSPGDSSDGGSRAGQKGRQLLDLRD